MECKIIKTIKKQLNVDLIYLFGSVINERFDFNSDIDIAIYSEQGIDESTLCKVKGELVKTLGREVDLIDLKEANPALIKEVIYKGNLIYSKNEDLKNNFEYRQLCLYNQYREDISIVKEKIKERGYIYGRNHSI